MADAPSAKFSFSGPEAAVTAASCVALPVMHNTGRSLVGVQWEAFKTTRQCLVTNFFCAQAQIQGMK